MQCQTADQLVWVAGNSALSKHMADAMADTSNRPHNKSNSIWLVALYDPVAGVKANSSCICTANITGDGDHRLLIADASKKLKIYKVCAPSRRAPSSCPCSTSTRTQAYRCQREKPPAQGLRCAAWPMLSCVSGNNSGI